MTTARKRTVRSSGKSGDQRFDFAVPLVKLRKGWSVYVLEIPARVSAQRLVAAGRWRLWQR
jgi:hypothetical protein